MPNYAPCTNPNCKSYGKSHPNCRDYDNLSTNELQGLEAQGYEIPGTYHGGRPGPRMSRISQRMAKGGVVKYACSESGHHHDDCHYAEGGLIDRSQVNPHDSVGHAAIDQGLYGLLAKAGQSRAEPEKQQMDYQASAKRGEKALHTHLDRFLGPQKASERLKPDPTSRKALEEHLDDLQQNPTKALDIGTNLSPDHATQVATHAATAMNYLQALKPKPMLNSPLDTPTEPDQMEQAFYERHLDIAQNPLHILQHISDGTLQPQDMKTLETLYPHLNQSMTQKAGDSLIKAKAEKKVLPYKQLASLGDFIGSPLTSVDSPPVIQAIIQSAAPQAAQRAQKGQKKQAHETAADLKTIQSADKLYQTPLEARQINRKS